LHGFRRFFLGTDSAFPPYKIGISAGGGYIIKDNINHPVGASGVFLSHRLKKCKKLDFDFS
jgi:hypothetical protein